MRPDTDNDAPGEPSVPARERARPPLSHGVLRILVPCMLSISSMFMALAWIGHLRFKHLPFLYAFGACWLLVLPEYYLNVKAIRWGHKVYSGAQMAAFRLCSGVVFVAIVARFVLEESFRPRQLIGFGVMIVAMLLITFPGRRPRTATPPRPPAEEAA